MTFETLQTIDQSLDKKTKSLSPKSEFDIVMSGQFCTLAMFLKGVKIPAIDMSFGFIKRPYLDEEMGLGRKL